MKPLRLPIARSDKGLVLGLLKNGMTAKVWREEFVVDVNGQFLFGRCDVPEPEGIVVDVQHIRASEALEVLKDMGKQIAERLGKNVELKVEEDPLGQGRVMFFECTVKPLQGVQLILVRALAYRIHEQHPKWSKQKVNEVLAYARVGKGPYAGEWDRMNARGPGEAKSDDAPAFGS